MEVLKKILLYSSGVTNYNLNIMLSANSKDLGFFDTLENDVDLVGQLTVGQVSGDTGYTFSNSTNFSIADEFSAFTTSYIVSGYSGTRLDELRKYAVTGGLSTLYIIKTGTTDNGLVLSATTTGTTASTYTYFIGMIKYIDQIQYDITTTSFEFMATGYSSSNFDNLRIIKLESKQNMVENPQVNADVFIERQQQPVFEKNYRLRGIGSLSDIISYAGGNYFTIYNNT